MGTTHEAEARVFPVEAPTSAIEATRCLGTASPGTVSIDLTDLVLAALATGRESGEKGRQ